MDILLKRIKYYRVNKDLTIADMSKIAGLSTGFISEIENGLKTPSFKSLTKICRALNVKPVELLNEGICPCCGQKIEEDK